MKLKGILLVGILIIVLGSAQDSLAATILWPQFDYNGLHSGNNPADTAITLSNVAQLKLKYSVTVPYVVEGAPVFLAGVSTAQGTKDLIFMTTRQGHIVALDAAAGSQIWAKQYPAGTCVYGSSKIPCYTNSSPAIDHNRAYVYTYGLDGKIHKLRVGDGSEVTGSGWPEIVTAKPTEEKGSSALTVVTTVSAAHYLYVVTSSYGGDLGDYQGHITAINLDTGSQKVFNALCSARTYHFTLTPSTDCSRKQAGIWARAGVVYLPATNRIYMTTGNGPYNPTNHDWGDTVIALNPDGTGANFNPIDTYTPTNYGYLNTNDLDLGSTTIAVLPTTSKSKYPNIGLQSGKDAKIRLINLSNLSGHGAPGFTGGEIAPVTNVPQGGEVLTQPAVWKNPADGSTWVFIFNDNGSSGLQLNYDLSGNPFLTKKWQTTVLGKSPVIVNGILYAASSGQIKAMNPLTGAIVWQSTVIGNIHWESPIVVNGTVFITDNSRKLYAFTVQP